MMPIPSCFLPQPDAVRDEETFAAFEQLYIQSVAPGTGAEIVYTLTAPKWQFLCYLAEQKQVLLHGSGKPDIAEFEPSKAEDVLEFGNRCAVYAASDGIWAIYFAIVDRDRYVTSLVNACFRIVAPEPGGPYYYFSINADALPHHPWRTGTLYLLPGDAFEQQPRLKYRGMEIELAHWASPVPIRPLAKLTVEPEDFPFLTQVSPHDPAVIRERAGADPDGFPWTDEPPTTPSR